MFIKFFQRLRHKMMAKQLRKPQGRLGSKVGNMMNKANSFLYDFTLDLVKPANKESILEIGFGNGKFFDKIFARAAGLKITGLDYSLAMLDAAKENNKKAVASGDLSLLLGSSDKLSFADNSFDQIFCINVIYFWDHPLQHLKEIKRVLKPGGRFYATVRTRESMLRMPFTKYGFSFYDTDKWKTYIDSTNLLYINEYPTNEPVVELDGKKFMVQSLCVIAEKKHS